MSGAILVLLDRPAMAPALLHAAARLAAMPGGASIHALIVRTPPEATILPTEEVLTARDTARIRAAEAQRAAALTAVFHAWQAHSGQPADLSDTEAVAAEAVAERGRAADFLVIGRPTENAADRPAVHAALFATGRPVLLVPPGDPAEFGRTVAIAWRDDGRAVKAVLPVLRLLNGAAQVRVLQGVRGTLPDLPLPAVFHDHGVAASMHVLPIGEDVFGQVLLREAHALGADLLVMGAYSHNPLREMIVGGVTRYMLGHADLPVLMRH